MFVYKLAALHCCVELVDCPPHNTVGVPTWLRRRGGEEV